jgi:hypothetical protein
MERMADRDDEHPELAGYEPGDGRPLRHPVTVRVMRVVIVLGVVALVLPGLVATVGIQQATATRACAALVARTAPGSDAVPRFELLGPAGPSWYCYGRGFDGAEVLLGSLGLIPG